eukprot:COSAG02_NODE_3229_length_7139_cov_2.777273_5_plen_111_part_00
MEVAPLAEGREPKTTPATQQLSNMEPEPQHDHEGADDISMNEIIRDVADSRITREEEETLSAEELAKKQAEKTVEVAAEMLVHQAAEIQENTLSMTRSCAQLRMRSWWTL